MLYARATAMLPARVSTPDPLLPPPPAMNGGPLSGFHNAPVSKSFVIASALLTAVFINRNPPINLGLSYQDIFEKFHLWKLIASVFAFSTTPELMFGLSLLYYFRVFERQIGSNKHTIFILFSVVVSLLFEVLAIIFLKDPSSTLASGPYGLIFASFIPFYFDIPVLSRFRLFGIQLSNKSFGYLSGFQLLFHCRKRSLLPGLCGVLAGILYRLNAFGIQKLKIPDVVSSFTSRLSWLSNSSSHAPVSGSTTRAMPSFTGHQVEAQGNDPYTVSAAVPEPSEASVATLVSMGFDINSARQALLHAGNDVNVATNILLESQSL